MRRSIQYLTAAGAKRSGRLRASEFTQAAPSRISTVNQASERGFLDPDRQRPILEDSVDEMLSSALVAQDKELAHILEEVDKISKTPMSDAPETQALTKTLERTVMCAVRQSLLDRELRSLALTDDLTCLYNRRAFLALTGQQLRVARRKAQGLLLFFADVDNLKEINDTYGHREGDLALVRAANALEQTFRNSDIVARLGGDEFAVLALEASCENKEVMLGRLERNLRGSNEEESRYELTLSVGMARYDPTHPVTLGELLAMADEAMYKEKETCRGYVVTGR